MFGQQSFVVLSDTIKTINSKKGAMQRRELLLGKKRLYEMYQKDDGSIDTTRPIALDTNGAPLSSRLFSFTDWQQSLGDTPQLAPGSRIVVDVSDIYASVAEAKGGQPARAFLQVDGEVVSFVNRNTPSSAAAPKTSFGARPKSLPQQQDGGMNVVPAPEGEDDPMF